MREDVKMRAAMYSGPKRSGVCQCGHGWDDHHLGIVVNPASVETDGGAEWYVPQECEFFGCNELGGLDEEGRPHCGRYVDSRVKE